MRGWLTATALAYRAVQVAAGSQCDDKRPSDVTLSRWIFDVEDDIGSGSVWMTLGGNASAHFDALACAMRRATASAVAPPLELEQVCVSSVCSVCAFS